MGKGSKSSGAGSNQTNTTNVRGQAARRSGQREQTGQSGEQARDSVSNAETVNSAITSMRVQDIQRRLEADQAQQRGDNR